jgi:hypothetical protein
MGDRLRVILETGPRGRVVGGAIDWPGLDRSGDSELDALARLETYLPRYAPIADRAALGTQFAALSDLDVVERVAGTRGTDEWGVAHVPSRHGHEDIGPAELVRRIALLEACWGFFDHVVDESPAELRPIGRRRGRTRVGIIRHVHRTEVANWSRKVGVRTPLETMLTPDGLAAHRAAYAESLLAYHAAGRTARSSPIAFLIRRTAQHVTDHAWELEDRGSLQGAEPS